MYKYLFNFVFTKQFSSITGLNELPVISDYGPMKNKEIRKFEIDRNKHKECRSATLKIKKEEQSEIEIKFFAVETAADAYIKCNSGEVTALETARNRMKQLKKCGIGTMLMQLCFNEERIHNVKYNEKMRP